MAEQMVALINRNETNSILFYDETVCQLVHLPRDSVDVVFQLSINFSKLNFLQLDADCLEDTRESKLLHVRISIPACQHGNTNCLHAVKRVITGETERIKIILIDHFPDWTELALTTLCRKCSLREKKENGEQKLKNLLIA